VTENILRGAMRGWKPIPVAVPSKAYVRSHWTAEIAVSKPADCVDLCLLCVLFFFFFFFFFAFCEGCGLCDELITRAEELYRLCVS